MCDHNWFVHNLLKANITAEQAEQITAIAIDQHFPAGMGSPSQLPARQKATRRATQRRPFGQVRSPLSDR